MAIEEDPSHLHLCLHSSKDRRPLTNTRLNMLSHLVVRSLPILIHTLSVHLARHHPLYPSTLSLKQSTHSHRPRLLVLFCRPLPLL